MLDSPSLDCQGTFPVAFEPENYALAPRKTSAVGSLYEVAEAGRLFGAAGHETPVFHSRPHLRPQRLGRERIIEAAGRIEAGQKFWIEARCA